MSGEAGEADGGEAIRLAREPDFALGGAEISPSTCQVRLDGRTERLEPRIMQVLVALARARGAVVPREDLARSCWEGRLVGEDAINRTLTRLRALARSSAAATYAIETIPRVGYRLTVQDAPPPHAPHTRVRRAAPVIAAALATAGIGVGFWAWRQARAPTRWEVTSYTSLASTPASERDPDLSPDGRFLLYTAPPPDAADGAFNDIYMRPVAGGAPTRIVAGPAGDGAPAWAPDGRRIAFVRSTAPRAPLPRGPHEPCRIMVKTLPAGAERLVGRCAFWTATNRLEWTDGGRALIYSDAPLGGRPAVMRLDLATGKVRRLTSPSPTLFGDLNAAVSPDGRKIAFRRYQTVQSGDIYVLDRKSGGLTRVSTDGAMGYLEWAPDSRSILSSSDRDGRFGLWSYPIDGKGEPRRLLPGLRQIGRLAVAGRLLAVESTDRGYTLVGLPASRQMAVITSGDREDYNPDISKRGDLAFLARQDGGSVWLQQPGEEARKLADLKLTDPHTVRWSPNSNRLALIANGANGRPDLWLLSPSRATPRPLRVGLKPLSLSWTADGTALLFAAQEPRGVRLWRVSVAGGRPVPVSGFGWVWAEGGVDGLYALHQRLPGVWRLRPGEQPVQLSRAPAAPVPSDRHAAPWAWTLRVFGDRLYLWERATDAVNARLWTMPSSGGRFELAQTYAADLEDFAMDPRTGNVVAVRAEPENFDIGVLRLRPSH